MNTFIDTYKNKNRAPFIIIWLGWMIYSVIEIVANIVRLATFQLVMYDWAFDFLFWWTRKTYEWFGEERL